MELNLIKIFVATFLVCNAVAFETGQLPISDKLEVTFPKIDASCFIIIDRTTNLVLHERNSKQDVNTGTFDYAISGQESDQITEGEVSNLFKMALKFSEKNKSSKQHVLFSSAMSGIGCAFVYRNSNGAEFLCLIYGEPLENTALEDVKKISNWLGQFYEYEIPVNKLQNTKIPIIYGTAPEITINDTGKHLVLLSKNLSPRINKVLRYRTILKAPVNEDDKIGYIFYQTEIFKNPIIKVLKTPRLIKKANWFKCIRDSFLYLIFGSTMHTGKKASE